MKLYLLSIKLFQELLLAVSVVILACLPSALMFVPWWFAEVSIANLYAAAHFSLFLVMLVRPLADIFRTVSWIRPLVILRKGVGVFSAAIVVSFIIKKIILDAPAYFTSFATASHWSFTDLVVLAHIADISAILLLITSNNFSKQLLGKNWKRVQRLSYVYFYGSGMYVYFILHDSLVLTYMVIVTIFTVLAWWRNRHLSLITTRPKTI